MYPYDFSNHQSRFIRMQDVPAGYLERLSSAAQADPFYPRWHIAPPCGLLNDPCGLFQSGGVHYIFHQWFPMGAVHGLKHWRLLCTRDFVHFEDRGIALEPSAPFDDHGCYTGMALPCAGGAEIFYTGIAGDQKEPSICRARFQDGEMREREVLMSRDPALSTSSFRDSFVVERSDQRLMLIGAQRPDGMGQILLSQGEPEAFGGFGGCRQLELRAAHFDTTTLGYMLECPVYFDTRAGGVLMFSPQGLAAQGRYDFKNVFSVVYGVGERLDDRAAQFCCGAFYELDKGFDFYAPQVYQDESGRRILFGWLGNSKSEYPTDKNGWAHMLTCPREVWASGDRLLQWPLAELKQLRGEGFDLGACSASSADGDAHIALDLSSFGLEIDGFASQAFCWELGNEAGDVVRFEATLDEYELDRSKMTHVYAERFGTRRFARRLDRMTTMRLLLDRSSIELFLDGGKTVFTARFFIDDPSWLRVRGVEGTCYQLSPIAVARNGAGA